MVSSVNYLREFLMLNRDKSTYKGTKALLLFPTRPIDTRTLNLFAFKDDLETFKVELSYHLWTGRRPPVAGDVLQRERGYQRDIGVAI